MAMTKLCINSFDWPSDEISRKRFEIDLFLEVANCILDGKCESYTIRKINHNTWARKWRDQEAVDEYYEFFYGLFPKYGGKLHSTKVIDI